MHRPHAFLTNHACRVHPYWVNGTVRVNSICIQLKHCSYSLYRHYFISILETK